MHYPYIADASTTNKLSDDRCPLLTCLCKFILKCHWTAVYVFWDYHTPSILSLLFFFLICCASPEIEKSYFMSRFSTQPETSHCLIDVKLSLFLSSSLMPLPTWIACFTLWNSYQLRKIAGCASAENAGNVFPATDFKGNRQLAIPVCLTVRAWRTCRDACRDRLPAAAGKTFAAFPALVDVYLDIRTDPLQ